MAAGKQTPSFDEIIQAGRQRAKNEALANEIFSRGRKQNAGQPKDFSKKGPQPGSLASRITPAGVGKRSASASSFKQNKIPSRPASAAAQKVRVERIGASLGNGSSQANVLTSNKSKGISIRGISSGPFYVHASNFAPGTTAADIEAAVLSVPGAAMEEALESCRIMTNSPTVIAEIVFTDRSSAEAVIKAFNGQKADGRILHLYIKESPAGVKRRGKAVETQKLTPVFRVEKEVVDVPLDDTAMNDVMEVNEPQPDVYEAQRTSHNSEREIRRADPEIQDGTQGFSDPQRDEPPRQPSSYRDAPRDDRDDRDGRYENDHHDRHVDKHYDDSGRDYSSRGDSYRRDDYAGARGYDRRDDRRDARPSYSNSNGGGFGGRGGGYNNSGFGRMYSDSMMPRGGRPRRGGGGYR